MFQAAFDLDIDSIHQPSPFPNAIFTVMHGFSQNIKMPLYEKVRKTCTLGLAEAVFLFAFLSKRFSAARFSSNTPVQNSKGEWFSVQIRNSERSSVSF